MPKYREIRSRIQGIENTSKITQAMKMVAAAKLRRAQDRILAARPYSQKLREILQFLASNDEVTISPLFEEREVERVALLVVSADRGLCGAFNSNIIKTAQTRINTTYASLNARGALDLICVGKRAVDFFTKRGYNVISAHAGIFNNLEYSIAPALVHELTEAFLAKRVDRVEVIYNEFKSVAKQTIAVQQFLPVPKLETTSKYTSSIDYIFEPTRDQLLESLLPKYLNTQMWSVLLESNAAEQGARMTSMENATRNAKDLVRSLRLIYNKARQSAITTEILEIVSGAEALRNQ